MDLAISKSIQSDKIVYTIPQQGELTNASVITVLKTNDGSLQVNLNLDPGLNTLDWATFCSNLEIGNIITVV